MSVKEAALTVMFETLEKAIQQPEKIEHSKDLSCQSEKHKQFYPLCKGIPFYRWKYLLNNHEAQHDELARETYGNEYDDNGEPDYDEDNDQLEEEQEEETGK
jgi:hypothetical protein